MELILFSGCIHGFVFCKFQTLSECLAEFFSQTQPTPQLVVTLGRLVALATTVEWTAGGPWFETRQTANV